MTIQQFLTSLSSDSSFTQNMLILASSAAGIRAIFAPDTNIPRKIGIYIGGLFAGLSIIILSSIFALSKTTEGILVFIFGGFIMDILPYLQTWVKKKTKDNLK